MFDDFSNCFLAPSTSFCVPIDFSLTSRSLTIWLYIVFQSFGLSFFNSMLDDLRELIEISDGGKVMSSFSALIPNFLRMLIRSTSPYLTRIFLKYFSVSISSPIDIDRGVKDNWNGDSGISFEGDNDGTSVTDEKVAE